MYRSESVFCSSNLTWLNVQIPKVAFSLFSAPSHWHSTLQPEECFQKVSLMMTFVLLKIVQEPLHQAPKFFHDLNATSFFGLTFYLIIVEMHTPAILNKDKALTTWFHSTAPIVFCIQDVLACLSDWSSVCYSCASISLKLFLICTLID